MLVEVRNTHWKNQGAQLMLRAAAERLGQNHQLVVSDRCALPATREELGLKRLVWVQGMKTRASLPELLLPAGMWKLVGRVAPRSVPVVLDASGFAYGDSWGTKNASISLAYARRIKARGGRYIFLPQALGPFEDPEVAAIMKELFELADLIFARDATSFAHVKKLIGDAGQLRQCCDFTIPLQARPYEGALPERALALIPNTKMLQKGGGASSYVPLMVKTAQTLRERGLQPFICIHAEDDHALGAEIAAGIGGEPPVIYEPDPLRLKGMLSRCELVISSRFHGLVSALAKGVPSLATGWSHKYAHLLEDFDCAEAMLPLDISDEDFAAKMAHFADADSQAKLRARILAAQKRLVKQVSAMWDSVEAHLSDTA